MNESAKFKDDACGQTAPKQFSTMLGHAGFTLCTSSFVLFEMLFVVMYSNQFWFALDIRVLGIPAVLIALLLGHLILSWQETPQACRLLSFIWQGKPPLAYRDWISVNDPNLTPGLSYGSRHLVFDAISELHLTMWGNLIFKSYKLCGEDPKPIGAPDIVFKLPFAVASPQDQLELIGIIRSAQPNVVLNQRLEKSISRFSSSADGQGNAAKVNQLLKQGPVYTALFCAVFLFVVLLDVGFSTFLYLETLKGYYLCFKDATQGDRIRAQEEYDFAEKIRLNPLPISWVTKKLFTQEPVGPALYDARTDALWSMGKKDEAIGSAEQALDLAPKSFRHNLRLARMLTAVGKTKEAENQIEQAIKNHKGNFLSALYMVALQQGSPPPLTAEAKAAYRKYKAAIDDEVFDLSDGPQWPPGGERFLHDIWYKDDVEYVYDRLIGPGQETRQETRSK